MKRVNALLSLLSLTAVVITIERISPTTSILLQPYNFLHLHEVVQIGFITAFSVIISLLLLKALSRDFHSLGSPRGTLYASIFILGVYFYATGNGSHEVASFLFNQYCDTKHFTSQLCGSLYFNDYFFGNIVYFIGLFLSNLPLVLLERERPDRTMTGRDLRLTLINGAVLALSFIAYDAFDRVAVGLVSSIVFAVVFDLLLLTARSSYRSLPFTLYSAMGFTIASVVALPIRMLS